MGNSSIFNTMSSIADKGSLGVNFFFVLSGFLITYLILHEKKYRGYFDYGKFLIRRTLRIWPLYFIIVLIGFLIFPLIFDGYETSHKPLNYIFFLANFDEIWYGANDSINFLTSPWSIAVEEQFYLFWGLTLLALLRFKSFKLEWLIGLLFLGSLIFTWFHLDRPRTVYYHTFSVCQDLLTGCFIGLSLFKGRKWLDKLREIKLPVTILIYIVGLGLCIFKNKIFQGDAHAIERTVLSFFFAFVILDQVRGKHSFYKFGKIKIFNYFGKISYGIYMYHLVVMYILIDWFNDMNWQGSQMIYVYFFVSLILILLVSTLSYRFIEKPFLKLKPH